VSRIFKHAAFAALAMIALPAGAATIVNGYTFDLTGNSSATNGTAGNSANFTGRASDGSTITATVTAWNATQNASGQYVLSQAYLGSTSTGLGVTSAANDNVSGTLLVCTGIGTCGTSQIDNMGNTANSSSIDFLRITFSAPIVLGSISRNVASISDGGLVSTTYDDDFSYGSGGAIASGDMLASLTGLMGTNVSSSCPQGLFAANCSNGSVLATASQATGLTASQNWYVGASIGSNYGGDGLVDAFKLTGVNAYTQSAVPEPATWTMMILGFGGIGSIIRRHRSEVRRLMLG
jgi:hypothetical protein